MVDLDLVVDKILELQDYCNLSNWEYDFINSVSEVDKYDLSYKQITKICEIYDKYNGE